MTRSTEEVLEHHLQAFDTGNLDGILEDYGDGSVIISGTTASFPAEISGRRSSKPCSMTSPSRA